VPRHLVDNWMGALNLPWATPLLDERVKHGDMRLTGTVFAFRSSFRRLIRRFMSNGVKNGTSLMQRDAAKNLARDSRQDFPIVIAAMSASRADRTVGHTTPPHF